MGTLSIWHWLIVLAIVVLIFGTKKLGSLGGDLGNAIRNFKSGLKGDSGEQPKSGPPAASDKKPDA